MNKRALSVCVLLMSVFMISDIAYAKVWLLPDYQESDLFSKRTANHGTKNGDAITCSTYGGIAEASLGNGQVCSGTFSLSNGTACCSSYKCSSEYKYNLDNCPTSKNLQLSGSTCVDSNNVTWHTGCGCSSDYQATDSICENGVDKTSGTCTFDGKTYYGSCNDDPCSNEDNVMVCAKERCGHVCGPNKCLKDKCNTNCEAGWDAVAGNCKKVECPTLYATSIEGCSNYGLTLIDNSELVLGNTTSGSVGGIACRICTVGCLSGYADYNQFWCEKTPVTNCETLGYVSKASSTQSCTSTTGYKELFCPFDTGYSICIKTGSTSTTDSPWVSFCASDELAGESVAHAYGETSSSTAMKCHKAACKVTNTTASFTSTLGTVYNLSKGGYVIASCAAGYHEFTFKGCITSCQKTFDPCDRCPDGAVCLTKDSGAQYMIECPDGWDQSGTETGPEGTCVTCQCSGYLNSGKACEVCGQYAYNNYGCYTCTRNGGSADETVIRCNYNLGATVK